jgi:hypothetical protein
VQSLEIDFYFGTFGSFDRDFTPMGLLSGEWSLNHPHCHHLHVGDFLDSKTSSFLSMITAPLLWDMENMYGITKRASLVFKGGSHHQIGWLYLGVWQLVWSSPIHTLHGMEGFILAPRRATYGWLSQVEGFQWGSYWKVLIKLVAQLCVYY